ncbi:MAG: tetratricopeptide repeat protein [Pseudomonadota bacterium]
MTPKAPRTPAGPTERRVSKMTVPEALRVAMQMHQQGSLTEAEALYERVLAVEPEHPDVLHFFGILKHQSGHTEEGIAMIRRAVERVPDYADAHNNLGNVLKESGATDEAEAAYRAVIDLNDEHADAHSNLAIILKATGRLAEAEKHCRRAVALQPQHADALINLSDILDRTGDRAEALNVAQQAMEHCGDRPETFANLARALAHAGRIDEARDVVERWLRFRPNDEVALHMKAAYAGGATPERASDAYVKRTFDEFASTYDTVLENIENRGPKLMHEAVVAVCGEPGGELRVLDAGCGTGLCGPDLARYAKRLVGVDLSPKMLERAAKRNCYDALDAVELVSYLEATEERFDLVICADTLVYFGDLAPFMRATAARLAPGGTLIFSVEDGTGVLDDAPFDITSSGRYCHAEDYVREVLDQAGFALGALSRETMRKEFGRPVSACIVRATLP